MEYSKLAHIYQKLESTTKNLEKRDILSEFFKKTDNLKIVVSLILGSFSQELGTAEKTIKQTIKEVSGASEKIFTKKYKKLGDIGSVTKELINNKKQQTLKRKTITTRKVYDNLKKLSTVEGHGSEERRKALLRELLSHTTGKEAKYIVRTLIGELRIGAGRGTIRDAIAKAFDKDKNTVEKAFNYTGDYGKVAEMAKQNALDRASITLGNPIHLMLARRATNLKEAIKKFDHSAVETKYDGFRIQIHKYSNKVRLFSRRLDQVTKQFPEIIRLANQCLEANECIVDSEVVATKNGKTLPFQKLSTRIKRKYNISKASKDIPVHVYVFDLIYLNGKNYMDETLRKRWKRLNEILEQRNGFKPATHIETNNLVEANKFYKKVLQQGHEGVMVKNMDAVYKPGRRVGYWLKVKPILEPLDLVIIGAEWGKGKRKGWLSSTILGARKGDEFAVVGKMGSGFTEEELEKLTSKLKKSIIKENGRKVTLEPHIVVEVGYEEIQKSPQYPEGFALRFPRLNRFREDKSPEDADSIERVKRIYEKQRGRDKLEHEKK